MPKISLILMLLLSFNINAACDQKIAYPNKSYPEVIISTSMGDIVVELDRNRSPITVNNFLRYVKNDSYINTIFHRVEKEFVIQGGGYDRKFNSIKECDKIFNESGNGLKNIQGSIAMARYDDPHSASSQFYFNLTDTPSLDPNIKNWGYTVFGSVIEGMDVLAKISAVKTGYSKKLDSTTVPITPIVIKKITVQ